MYGEGTYFSEKYSHVEWDKRGWDRLDDDKLYEALDSYIKFLRIVDIYETEE